MTATRLDDRYGRAGTARRGRLRAVVGVAVLVVAAAAWAVWSGLGGVGTSLTETTVGYAIHGDSSVDVRWAVTGRAGDRLVCAIQAEDGAGVVLGLVEVVLPATGSAVRNGTTTVRTTRTADSGLIESCRTA